MPVIKIELNGKLDLYHGKGGFLTNEWHSKRVHIKILIARDKTKACNKPITDFCFYINQQNYFLNKLQFFSGYADKPYQAKKF